MVQKLALNDLIFHTVKKEIYKIVQIDFVNGTVNKTRSDHKDPEEHVRDLLYICESLQSPGKFRRYYQSRIDSGELVYLEMKEAV